MATAIRMDQAQEYGETTNANRPLPAKEVYGGWIENDELGLHYSDGWLQDGKYPWFILE